MREGIPFGLNHIPWAMPTSGIDKLSLFINALERFKDEVDVDAVSFLCRLDALRRPYWQYRCAFYG